MVFALTDTILIVKFKSQRENLYIKDASEKEILNSPYTLSRVSVLKSSSSI